MSIHKVRFTGGPHGKNGRLEIDGQEIGGVRKVTIDASVNDVVKITVDHVMLDMESEIEGVVRHRVYLETTLRIPGTDDSFEYRHERLGEGESLLLALKDAVAKLDVDAG